MKKIIRNLQWGWEETWATKIPYTGKTFIIFPEKSFECTYVNNDTVLKPIRGSVKIFHENGELVVHLMENASFNCQQNIIYKLVTDSTGCDLIEITTPNLGN